MTSTSKSPQPSKPETVAVVAHGRIDVATAVERVRKVAAGSGTTVVDEPADADLTVAVGGDGTILRTLARLLGSDVPVIGVNFGRVGFLASIAPEALERDLARVFGGEFRVLELPTLDVTLHGEQHVAVNDVVTTSASPCSSGRTRAGSPSCRSRRNSSSATSRSSPCGSPCRPR